MSIFQNNSEILRQVDQLRLVKNWQEIVRLLSPLAKEGQPGWQDPEIMSALGFAYSQLGKLEKARAAYLRWIEIEPDRAQPFYCLGYVFAQEGRYEEAIRWYEQALKIFPNYLVCNYRLGYAYYAWGKPKKALKPLREVIRVYQNSASEQFRRSQARNYHKAIFTLARALHQTGDDREALEWLQKLYQIDTRQFIRREFLNYAFGKVLAGLERFDEALQYLDKAFNRRNPQAYVLDQLGRVYHLQQQYLKALEKFERALRIRRMPYILNNRAETLLALGRKAEAIADLHQSLKIDRKGQHKTYLRLGQISQDDGKLTEAEHYYRCAIQFKQDTYHSGFAEAYLALARLYRQRDEISRAEEAYREAMQISPDLCWESGLAETLAIPNQNRGTPDSEIF